MKYFKLKYADNSFEIVKGQTALEVIMRYDLATKEHTQTRIIELEGEQLAIAISNDMKNNDRYDKDTAIEMLTSILEDEDLLNRGDIIQDLQDVIEFINKNL